MTRMILLPSSVAQGHSIARALTDRGYAASGGKRGGNDFAISVKCEPDAEAEVIEIAKRIDAGVQTPAVGADALDPLVEGGGRRRVRGGPGRPSP